MQTETETPAQRAFLIAFTEFRKGTRPSQVRLILEDTFEGTDEWFAPATRREILNQITNAKNSVESGETW